MKELLKYELYKIFCKKGIYIVAILFLTLYGLFISEDISLTKSNSANIENYKEFEGPVTPQKVEKALEIKNNLDSYRVETEDGSIFLNQEGRMKDNLQRKVLGANERLQEYNSRLNSLNSAIKKAEAKGIKDFSYKRDKLEYSMRKSVSIPGIYYIAGWSKIIDFVNTLGLVFIGGLILLGVCPAFSEEYANNMDSLILSSKNGKGKVITAKILSSFIYIFAVTSLFAAVNIGVNINAFGIYGWNSPIQSLYKYTSSPFSLNAAEYHALQLIIQLTGSLALGLLVLAISAVSKSSLIPFFVGGFIFSLPILLKSIIEIDIPWIQEVVNLSYTSFMKVEEMFMNFKVYNVFGYPVLYLHAAIFVIGILAIVSTLFIYHSFRNHQVG